MSEINTVRSGGTLKLISGKKYRGELVANETGAAFYAKGQKEPIAEWVWIMSTGLAMTYSTTTA